MAVPQISGTLAAPFGSAGSFDLTTNQFPGHAAGVEVHITEFTPKDISEMAELKGKNSTTIAVAVAERPLEYDVNFIVCADTKAKAAAVKLPTPMQLLTVAGRDNAEENGDWNVVPGTASFTGGVGVFKTGTMTLRRFHNATFTDDGTAFSELS